MAKTYSDQVYSGTLSTSETTIATIASNTTFILNGFWISNANVSNQNFTLKLNDKRFAINSVIPTKDTLIEQKLSIPILTTQTIKLTGSVDSDMDYYIWGVNEVTS